MMTLGGTSTAWGDELTVANGTNQNSYCPFEAGNADYAVKGEYIVPATDLVAMDGKVITAIKLYATSNNTTAKPYYGTNEKKFQVFMKEVTNATPYSYSSSTFQGTDGATTVYEGTLTVSSNEMLITFSNTYTYNGGNLLIGFYKDCGGAYLSNKFYGVSQDSYTGCSSYSSSGISYITSGTGRSFIPKTTFTYEDAGALAKPTGFECSSKTYNSATLSWTAGGTETAWQLVYDTDANFDKDAATPVDVTTNPYILTGLTPETTYYAYLRAKDGSDVSAWTSKISFDTPEQYIKPTALTIDSRVGTTATLSWTAGSTETAWELVYSTNSAADPNALDVIAVNTTPTHTLTGLIAGSTYYVWVRAKYGESQYSGWVNSSFSLTYQAAAPTSVDGSGITNVTFGSGAEVLNSNDRPTSSPYFGDYSAQIGGATAGQSSNLAITFSTGYSYGTVVWVDWNQNYEFEDSEIVFAGESGNDKPSVLDASFTIPALQAAGNYRMRIAAADSYYDSHKTMATAAGANPYPTETYCVVHDYTLKVNEASAYSMSITGSDVSENTITFGTVKNTTTTKTFTINNDGGNDLTGVSVVSSDAEVFTVSETGFDIAVGDHKDIIVTFIKAVDGDYSKTITISQANIATPIVLTATATYVTPTPATMAATLDDVAVGETVAFGTVNKATTKTFKVSNTGEATLNATIALSGADADKFALSTTSLVVAGGSNETFTVTFDSDEEDVAKTATVTLSAAGLSNVAFNVTGTYSNFWTEDFAAGTLPTGWVITPGSYSGDSYAWHIGTFSSYENKTNMAIAPTSTSYNTIITPRLAAKKDDVLTWDAYFNWNDEYLTIEYSNDEKESWTPIMTVYGTESGEKGSGSQTYYHKGLSFTAPADGNYYLRFTSRYSNGIDNFAGFKLNPKTHDAVIASKTIPATGNQYVEYTASVTVNELLGKTDEVVTAELWIGTTKVATEADVTLNASASKVIELTFTPAAAMSGDAYIKVYNANLDLISETQTVTIAAALVLDEDVAPGELTTGTKPSIVVNYNAKDGWNTICTPFALTSDILTSTFGTGWKAYEFKSYSDGALGFQSTTTFYAGYPYIVYVETAAVHAEGVKLQNVYISWPTAQYDQYSDAYFRGTYAPIAAGGWTKNVDTDVIYGVTSAGKIQKAGASATMKGFRAYFDLPAGATARLAIYDEATGITTILDAKELSNDGKVYNLNGQRVENARKGLYIVNGKKIVVK